MALQRLWQGENGSTKYGLSMMILDAVWLRLTAAPAGHRHNLFLLPLSYRVAFNHYNCTVILKNYLNRTTQ